MSNNLPEPTKSDEVDIIQIFNLIGKAFKSLFNFIGNILEQLFKLFIILILFIKKHVIKIGIAGAIGFIAGSISDYREEVFYTNSMVVRPNFSTNEQLLERLKLLQHVTRLRDTFTLAETLKLPIEEARNILYIGYKPLTNVNSRLKSFNEFVKDADTLTIKNVDFKDYQANLDESDYRRYQIVVNSKTKDIFKKFEQELINIPITDFVKDFKKTYIANVKIKDSLIRGSLSNIDSLRQDYRRVMFDGNNAKDLPKTSGNNFYLSSQSKRPTNELELFQLEEQYYEELNDINNELRNGKNYVNIISGFQNVGIGSKKKNRNFMTLVAMGLAILGLLLIEFNKFLNKYEKKYKINE